MRLSLLIVAWFFVAGMAAEALQPFEETFSGTGSFASLLPADGLGHPIAGLIQTAGLENDHWVHYADNEPAAMFDTTAGTLDFFVSRSRDPLAREWLQREIGGGDFVEEIRFSNLNMGQTSLSTINLVHQGDGFDAFSFQISDFGSPGQLSLFLSLNYVFLPAVRVLDFAPGSDLAIRVGWTEDEEQDSGQYVVETSVDQAEYSVQFDAAFSGRATPSRTAMIQFGVSGFAEELSAALDYWSVTEVSELQADFNQDGVVDGDDFLVWQSNFITTSGGSLSDGDADADGDVDGSDFLVWQTEFGLGTGGQSAGPPAAALPELTALMLLIPATVAVAAFPWRRRPSSPMSEELQDSERSAVGPKLRKLHAGILLTCLLTGWAAIPALAVSINMNFDPGSDSPAFDPGGTMLQALADDAARFWEDIFEDTHTVNVTYRYDSIDGLANGTANSVSGGRPVTGTINVDSDNVRTWFFDTTPLDNSEFNLNQILYRDLSSSQQSAWYNSTPPELLEVSFRGTADSSAPAAARNGFDMFSTLLHEIGHVLGLSNSLMARVETVGEGDFDFDVASTFNAGNAFAIAAAGTDRNDVNDWAHIAAQSLMCSGCAGTGLRRMPAATDVFAIASAAGWSTNRVDLLRQDFLAPQGTDWNTPGNWEGNQVPLQSDVAFVRNGNNIELSADGHVANLLIDENSSILTNDNRLTVDDTATIGSVGDAVLQIADINNLGSPPEFFANHLIINDGSMVQQIGDTSLVDIGEQLIVKEGGLYLGSGTLNVAATLRNDGTISGGADVLTGGELVINATEGNMLDLDGSSGDGVLNATMGDLTINGPQAEEFAGVVNISETRTMTFNNSWEMRGHMNLSGNGDPGAAAILAGSTVNVTGVVNVDGADNKIVAPTLFKTGAVVELPDPDDKLELDGTITYEGGSFIGNGTLYQDGEAVVASSSIVTLDVATHFRNGSHTTINAATELALANAGVVRSGADFVGAGKLRNLPGATLSLEDAAEVGVLLDNEGTLVIGSSPAAAVAEAFEQSSTGSLEIELGGLNQGTEYDWLKVATNATLGGTLDVSLIDLGSGPFEPSDGDLFKIITAGNPIFGTFSNEVLPPLPLGLGWNVLYADDFVALSVEALSTLAADFDKDGDVDGEDFLIWQTNFITTSGATSNDGDSDGDGDVDGADFLAWQTQFGFGLGLGAGGNAATAIPEPHTVALLISALATLATRRRAW